MLATLNGIVQQNTHSLDTSALELLAEEAHYSTKAKRELAWKLYEYQKGVYFDLFGISQTHEQESAAQKFANQNPFVMYTLLKEGHGTDFFDTILQIPKPPILDMRSLDAYRSPEQEIYKKLVIHFFEQVIKRVINFHQAVKPYKHEPIVRIGLKLDTNSKDTGILYAEWEGNSRDTAMYSVYINKLEPTNPFEYRRMNFDEKK